MWELVNIFNAGQSSRENFLKQKIIVFYVNYTLKRIYASIASEIIAFFFVCISFEVKRLQSK